MHIHSTYLQPLAYYEIYDNGVALWSSAEYAAAVLMTTRQCYMHFNL